MHPKFILMDRQRAWFPSCNVSWEEWFEGCVELRGPITDRLFDFWGAFWGRQGGGMEVPATLCDASDTRGGAFGEITVGGPAVPTRTKSSLISGVDLPPSATQTILLPSPHHRNPLTKQLPSTPLNTFLLALMATATGSIWMQTPNLTCGPVLVSLFIRILEHHDCFPKFSTSFVTRIPSVSNQKILNQVSYYQHPDPYRKLFSLPSAAVSTSQLSLLAG
jgi:hypothetical protein